MAEPKTATMPKFLIIGAARAGTTALHAYLRQHPQVFMPAQKEPNFFAFEDEDLQCKGPGADYINNSTTELSAYHALFQDAPDDAICGEASPLYLFAEKAPERIKHHIPDAKMIVILRDPIDQAYSHFMYATKQCIEEEADFAKALELEEERLAAGWQPLFGYSAFPRYAEQLERFFELFPREQFLIRTYEDFQNAPETLMQEIYTFIGANPDFTPDMGNKPNAGGVPKNQAFQDFLMKPNPITKAIGFIVPQGLRWRIRDELAKFNLSKADGMPGEAARILHARLDDEIRRLETLLDRDFSAWRT